MFAGLDGLTASLLCLLLDFVCFTTHSRVIYLNEFFYYQMQKVFIDDQELIVEDVDFCDSRLVMMVREGRTLGLCSVLLPLPSGQVRSCSLRLQPCFY